MPSDAEKITAELAERERKKPKMITLGTGVVLLFRPISQSTMLEIVSKASAGKPVPPRVFIKAKEREEENPNDPAYIAAVEKYNTDQVRIFNDMMLMLGTSVQEVPASFPKWDDTGWEGDLEEVFGLEIPKEGKKRYLAWLKHLAVLGQADLEAVLEGVADITGISEKKAAAAAENFPGSS